MAEVVSGYTVELIQAAGNDRLIAQGAYVCTGNDIDLKTDEQVAKTIQMLAREGHGTPFEYASFTWLIRHDIANDRQVVTYRAAKRNGESMRYFEPEGDFLGLPEDVKDILYRNSMVYDVLMYDQMCLQAHRQFRTVLDNLKAIGVSKEEYRRVRECYRRVLPLATMTNRLVQMDVRNFANFLSQRLDSHAQPEIRGLAMQMLGAAMDAKTCPVALAALSERNWKL